MGDDEPPMGVEQVCRLLDAEYDLGFTSGAWLLNSAGNDTFAVEIGGVRYVLRIYGRRRWYISGPGDYRYELGLLAHLHHEGIPVSVPIPRRDGEPLGRVAMPHERTLLDRFVAELEPSLLDDDPSDVRLIRAHVEDIRRRIRAFNPGPGGWGIVHGDVQPHNHHLTEDGQVIWFDFDLCGFGWRAYDIAYYYTRIPEPVRAPVIEGYESVRPLSRAEHEMLPTIGRLAWIREGLRSTALVKRLREPYMSYQ